MRNWLEKLVSAEAKKLVARHQRYINGLNDEATRILRRSGAAVPVTIQIPAYWALDPGFDPYKVRVRSKSISYAVAASLANDSYAPRAPVLYGVPKKGGGTRNTAVFQVADNAVSRLTFKRLMSKNASRMSAYSYAYRTDRTVHDAVISIAASLKGQSRVFVAEFDFSKFFDTISHEHLERQLADPRFFVTERERSVLRAFMRATPSPMASYNAATPPERTEGIPQGTSVSLFLANLAAHPLDSSLERLGVQFARFADDTIVWSDSYSRVCDAYAAIETAAERMGVRLNLAKSEGISLITPLEAPAELRSKSTVEFVGYEIGQDRTSMKRALVDKAKTKVAGLIYRNLLEPLKRGHRVPHRWASPIDRDYVVLIFQIRRYLYGNLNEHRLRRYLARDAPRMHYRGFMSFFPIVDDDDQLKALDGWMIHNIERTLAERARLIGGATKLPAPHGLNRDALLALRAKSRSGADLDLRVPSFRRIARLLNSAAGLHGAAAIAHPASSKYSPS